jgi:glycosyltransferase involved in cell wall biosynthesis
MTTLDAELDASIAHFAPGSAADFDQGVLYKGDFQHPNDGTAIAIRGHARALADVGVPVLLKPHSAQVLTSSGRYEPLHFAGIPDSVRAEVGKLTTASIGRLHPVIQHFVIHKAEDISSRLLRGAVGPLDDPENILQARVAIYDNTVVYSVWERDRLDEATIRELRQVRDVWVPCEMNAEMLIKNGLRPEQVFVVPHPYPSDSPLLHLYRRAPYPEKRFYFIGRWEPRKNPALLLETFCRAFEPGGSESLVMKYHGAWQDYPTFAETVRKIVAEGKWTERQIHEQVTAIEGFLRPDQILKLHYDNNIYAGPSEGEAFCLPAFEAKLAGNLVIHTPFGGTADFCDRTDLPVAFKMGPVPPSYGWPRGSQWADVDGEHLCYTLQRCKPPESFKASRHFLDRHSSERVGMRMAGRLRERFEGIRW